MNFLNSRVPVFLFIGLLSSAVYGQSRCSDIFSKTDTISFIDFTMFLNQPNLSQETRGLIPSGMGLLHQRVVPLEVAVAILKNEHIERRNTAIFDLREVELRNLGIKELADLMNDGALGHLTVEETQKAMKDSMQFLYDAYRKQGPEREALIPDILKQDKSEAPRVTHFMTTRWIQPLVHTQILIATRPSEKLHVEEAWPTEAKQFGRRYDSERIGELGRLFALSPNSKPLVRYEETLTVDNLSKEDMTFFQFLTIKNAIHWALYEARLDRLLQQTNLAVERVLKRNGFPLHLGERTEVQKKWTIDGKEKEVTEVVYSFNRAAMKEIGTRLMKILLKRWVQEIETLPYYQRVPEYFFKFMARDIPSLRALGVVGTSPAESIFVFPKELMDHLETGASYNHFVFPLVRRDISLLKKRIN